MRSMIDTQEVLDNFYHEYGDGITQIGIYDNEAIPIEFRERFEELMSNLYKLYNDMSDWYYG